MKINRREVIRGALVMIALTASMLSGCGKKDGEEYVGTWQEKERKATVVQVERNGDGFLMKTTSTNRRGEKQAGSVPATLKDGVLKFPNGPVTGSVTYIKGQDEVLVSTFAGNFAFARVK